MNSSPAVLLRLVLCLLMAGLPACSAAVWRDRWADLGQVVDLGLTVGAGVQASVRFTPLLQGGLGAFDGVETGWIDGRWAQVREQRGEFGVSLLHLYRMRRNGRGHVLDIQDPRFADPGYREYQLSYDVMADRHTWEFGVTAHLVLVGANFAFRFDQLFDFLAGCVGFDPLGDDAFSVTPDQLVRQARSSDPYRRARAFDALLRRGEPIFGYAIYTNPEVFSDVQREAVRSLVQEDGEDGGE